MPTFLKTLAIAGCSIFCFATLGMLYQEAIMVIPFVFFLPGPVFGLIVSVFKEAPLLQRIIFFITACLIYQLTLYIVDVKNMDFKLSPAKFLLASTFSAVLVQLFFDLTFRIHINYKNTFVLPASIGFAASTLTTLAGFVFQVSSPTGLLSILLWFGLFSIFPIWFILFGRHLLQSGRVSS